MLVDDVLENALFEEIDIVDYCKTLTGVNVGSEEEAQDKINDHLKNMESLDLIKLANSKGIFISPDEAVKCIIFELSTVVSDSEQTINVLKLLDAILDAGIPNNILQSKLKEYSTEDGLSKCFR